MRTPIKTGSVILLHEVGSAKKFPFTIKEIIGMGGSCIVYTAVYCDAENNRFPVRLKECCPEWIESDRNDTALSVSDEYAAEFETALQQFTDGYQKQMLFREQPKSMNSIANIQGIYEGNGTKYIAMSCQNAIPLPDDMLLYDIFRMIRAVTLQIANFHDNGYLYLDLKPQNVMLYPETPEMVMLFDFDSAMPMDDIQPAHLSCTDTWAAPEVLQHRLRDVGISTDIYGIGAMLMYLLFHRPPNSFDSRRGASWDDEIENSILKTEKPEIKRTIREMFTRTLAANPKKRYLSCDDLLEVIEPLIAEYQKPKPYLKTFLPMGNNFFCGRDTEIGEIHDALQDNDLLVLHGIGGIGKSELAKHYALQYADEYDAAVFVRFQGNIQDTILNDVTFPIVNCQRGDDESDHDYLDRKIQILQEICTNRHLLILDNFDVDDCEDLELLLKLHCKLLITSRIDQSDVFPQKDIDVLRDIEYIRSVFRHYTRADTDDDTDRIIYALDGHTMGIELVARQMKITGISSQEMYERLAENGLSATPEQIRNFKDGSLRNKPALKHLEILFTVFGLSEEQQEILAYFSMIGTTPVTKDHLIALCEFDEDELIEVDYAVHSGWIQLYDDTFQLHPLICEVLLKQLNPDIKAVWVLIKHLIEDSEEKLLQNMSAEQRFRQEQIMLHTAKHIYGEPAILCGFLKEIEKIYATYKAYDQAEQTLLRRMELADQVWSDDPSEYVFEYYNLADYAIAQGAYERAEEYRQIANSRLSKEDQLGVAYQLAFDDGNFDEAKTIALHMLECAETTEEYYEAYSNLADTEDFIGEKPERKKKYAAMALHYAKMLIQESITSNPDDAFELWRNAGDAALLAEDYEETVPCLQKALALALENKETDYIIVIETDLAVAYAMCEQKNDALHLLKHLKAFVLEHYIPEHPDYPECVALCASGYSQCYQKTADTDYLPGYISAVELLLETDAPSEKLGQYELWIANSLIVLSEYEAAEEHTMQAIAYYDAAFEDAAPELAEPLSQIWHLLWLCGNSDYKDYYDLTISICEEFGMEDEAEANRQLFEECIGQEA